ncbi:MAG: U32 family peptidase [Candidatus Iainarchaeum sp.]|jgi:putative protease
MKYCIKNLLKINSKGIKLLKKPELLMPAGNLEKLKIAINNNADAVYFGSIKFNARQLAYNFTFEEMKEGIDYCHLNNKKAYLTLNTLILNEELEEAIEIAKKAYELGIDAIIIQDLGLYYALKKLLPNLELHASTQMTCNNLQGATLLAEMGFKRIILARELNLNEIKEITKVLHEKNCEAEVFIHGAECFCYSGQCLFSSFAFNKSGNRGRCLQPCRLEYETSTNKSGRLLSMKDLTTYNIIGELIKAGVDSFKVEGRLKNNEYIQNVARVYRKTIDGYFDKKTKPTSEELNEMKKSFLRENSSLYLSEEKELTTKNVSGNKGIPACKIISFKGQDLIIKTLFEIKKSDKLTLAKDENYSSFFVKQIIENGKTIQNASRGKTILIKTTYPRPFLNIGDELCFTTPKKADENNNPIIYYNLSINAQLGEKIKFRIEIPELKNFEKNFVEGESDFITEKAQKTPTTTEVIKDKIFKEFYFLTPKKFSCKVSENIFIPLSKLKELKRLIELKTKEELLQNKKIPIDFDSKLKELLNKINSGKKNLNTQNQKKEFFFFIEEHQKELIEKNNILNKKIVNYYINNKSEFEEIVKPQNIMSSKELKELEEKLNSKNKLFCTNLGSLKIALDKKIDFFIEREMNCFNSLAVIFFIELGAKGIIPSIELSLKEINSLPYKEKLIPLIYFYPLLMTSKAYAKNDSFGKSDFLLKDRKEFIYQVKNENNLMKIYNPLPVDMAYELEKFDNYNTLGIDFKATTNEEIKEFLNFLEAKILGKKISKTSKFTRGHYEKPVE